MRGLYGVFYVIPSVPTLLLAQTQTQITQKNILALFPFYGVI